MVTFKIRVRNALGRFVGCVVVGFNHCRSNGSVNPRPCEPTPLGVSGKPPHSEINTLRVASIKKTIPKNQKETLSACDTRNIVNIPFPGWTLAFIGVAFSLVGFWQWKSDNRGTCQLNKIIKWTFAALKKPLREMYCWPAPKGVPRKRDIRANIPTSPKT